MSLADQLEKIAEALVFADGADLAALAGVHTLLEDLGQQLAKAQNLEVSAAAVATAKFLERIILGDIGDAKTALAVVNQAVSGLQSVLCGGRNFAEAVFPEELGLAKAPVGRANTVVATSQPQETAPVAPKEYTAQSEPKPEQTTMPANFDLTLAGEFVAEAREHLDAADVNLLTLETEPQNQEALAAVFRAFHTIKGVAGFLSLEEIGKLAHEAENLLDRARKGELQLANGVIDVAFEAADVLKRLVNALGDALAQGTLPAPDGQLPALLERIRSAAAGMPVKPARISTLSCEPGKKLGDILIATNAASPQAVEDALQKQHEAAKPKLGEILVKEGQASAQDVAHALRTQKLAAVQVKEAVKVDAERLDRLLETIGELVIAESMVTQSKELCSNTSAQLARNIRQLDKITRELQEMGTSMRMVPVKATFQKMARLVRDLSHKANKKVEFATSGEETELDKSVVDLIGDPLVHMIRNAVDHGIEAPAERQRLGKQETGRVELRAFHKGGNIYITLEDDGKGLDREAILAKARERGLLRTDETPPDHEIYNLIFLPGFSTAKQVTDVSGRGVGMDVVKRNIEALRGQVDMKSDKGKGTTFTIRLPLTLAIIDGMVIRLGVERYIMPTLSMVRTVRPEAKDILTVLGRGEMLRLQEELIPLFRLDSLFSAAGQRDATAAVAIITEDSGKKAAILADELLGQQQIVIKSLGESMRGIPGVSGGAIMSDGTVGLILDVGGLVRLANAGCEHKKEAA